MQNNSRRPRTLAIAFTLSAFVHLCAIPFVHARAPAAAAAAPTEIVTITHLAPTPPPPRPTPMPRPMHARASVARPVALALAVPHTHAVATQTKSVALAQPRSEAHGSAPHAGLAAGGNATAASAGTAPSGAPVADPVVATPTPATPEPSPTPGCASTPHEASVIDAVTPDRPQLAEDEGATGRVQVRVDLAPSGAVVTAKVYVSSGNAALDAAAVTAAMHARYAPANDGCTAIGGSYLYVVDYSG